MSGRCLSTVGQLLGRSQVAQCKFLTSRVYTVTVIVRRHIPIIRLKINLLCTNTVINWASLSHCSTFRVSCRDNKSTDKDSLKIWSFQGPVKKAYDKSCKGFIMLFDQSTKAQIPSDIRNEELYLVQPYLLLQLMIMDKKLFHLEVTFTDQAKVKRRLIFNPGQNYSNSKDNIAKQPLHARVPCDLIREGVWLNLQFDIYSFIDACFGNINFRSIDAIAISGACRLRKVMTMKSPISDSTSLWLEREYGSDIAQEFEESIGGIDYNNEELPSNLNFTAGVDYINQVISYDRVSYWGYLQDMLHNGSEGDKRYKSRKLDIAFGRRVTNKPVVQGRQHMEQVMSNAQNQRSPQRALEGAHQEGIIYSNQVMRNASAERLPQLGAKQNQSYKMSRQGLSSAEYQLKNNRTPQRYQSPESNNRSQMPKSMIYYSEESPGFSDYKVSSSKKGSPQRRPPMPSHNHESGDAYLNEKLKYLNQQRQIIHQLAAKYNLNCEPQIEKFTLITMYHNGKPIQQPESFIAAQDPKDRVREYHQMVNSKRRMIHEQQLQKKKVWKRPEYTMTKIKAEENNPDDTAAAAENSNTPDNNTNLTENNQPQTKKEKQRVVNQVDQEEDYEGWDGQNEQEEDNAEKDENDEYSKEEEEEEYGKEEANENKEDYGEEEEVEGGEGYGDEEY